MGFDNFSIFFFNQRLKLCSSKKRRRRKKALGTFSTTVTTYVTSATASMTYCYLAYCQRSAKGAVGC